MLIACIAAVGLYCPAGSIARMWQEEMSADVTVVPDAGMISEASQKAIEAAC